MKISEIQYVMFLLSFLLLNSNQQGCSYECLSSCEEDTIMCLFDCECDEQFGSILSGKSLSQTGSNVTNMTSDQLKQNIVQMRDDYLEYKYSEKKIKKQKRYIEKLNDNFLQYRESAERALINPDECDMHCAYQCIKSPRSLNDISNCITLECKCNYTEDISDILEQERTDLNSSENTSYEQTNTNSTLKNIYMSFISLFSSSNSQDNNISQDSDNQEEDSHSIWFSVTLVVVAVAIVITGYAILKPKFYSQKHVKDVETNSKGKVKYVSQKKKNKNDKKTHFIAEKNQDAEDIQV